MTSFPQRGSNVPTSASPQPRGHGQSSHDAYHAEVDSLHAEATERGVTIREVAAERQAAAKAERQAEAARVAGIVNDPMLLQRLKRYWNRGLTGEWIQNPLDPPPAPAPRTGPPSSGRQVSGGRAGVYGGGMSRGGTADAAALAAAMGRVRNRI